jgi:hypothetical protein
VQAYSESKQPAKAVDAAADLVSKGTDAAGSAANAVKLLFMAAAAIQQVTQPTAEQLATGEKAARELLVFNKKPEGMADDAWTQARPQLQAAARGALMYTAVMPGVLAINRKDCVAAETALKKALDEHPESAQIAWYLGTAQLCLYKTQPDKAAPAIYAIARAAAVDPVKGMVDPNWQKTTVEPYLEKIYTSYHGKDPEGLRQLKELAARSPLPPPDFRLKSVTEIAQEKQAEFEASHPQLALWLKIKGALADTNGEQYFASSLKDADVPQLKGVLVEAKPACRPKELLVAVPMPDARPPFEPEISIKLDKPLTGKPDPGTEFRWKGVPTAFAPSPFLVTMDAEAAAVEGLKTGPCTTAPAKKATRKTGKKR